MCGDLTFNFEQLLTGSDGSVIPFLKACSSQFVPLSLIHALSMFTAHLSQRECRAYSGKVFKGDLRSLMVKRWDVDTNISKVLVNNGDGVKL